MSEHQNEMPRVIKLTLTALAAVAALACSGCAEVAVQSVTNTRFSAEKYQRMAVYATSEVPTAPGGRQAAYVSDSGSRSTPTGRRVSKGLLNSLEDKFNMALMMKGYSVAARKDMERAVAEITLQNSGLTSSTEENAARIGKVLNVPAILIVSVNKYEETIKHTPASSYEYKDKKGEIQRGTTAASDRTVAVAALSARLVDVATTEILWAGQADSEGDDTFKLITIEQNRGADNLTVNLAAKIAETIPARIAAAPAPRQ